MHQRFLTVYKILISLNILVDIMMLINGIKIKIFLKYFSKKIKTTNMGLKINERDPTKLLNNITMYEYYFVN